MLNRETEESKSVSGWRYIRKTGLAIVAFEDRKVPWVKEYGCLQNLEKAWKQILP